MFAQETAGRDTMRTRHAGRQADSLAAAAGLGAVADALSAGPRLTVITVSASVTTTTPGRRKLLIWSGIMPPAGPAGRARSAEPPGAMLR